MIHENRQVLGFTWNELTFFHSNKYRNFLFLSRLAFCSSDLLTDCKLQYMTWNPDFRQYETVFDNLQLHLWNYSSCRDNSPNINIKEELIRISSYLVKETWHEPGVGISGNEKLWFQCLSRCFFLIQQRRDSALHCWLNSTEQEFGKATQEAQSPENPEALKLNLFNQFSAST